MFVCQFFGYAVTYNDSFSTSHSGVCGFFCSCLEELSKFVNDGTISPDVNQTETHFPLPWLPLPFHNAGIIAPNCSAKVTVVPSTLSYIYSTHMSYLSRLSPIGPPVGLFGICHRLHCFPLCVWVLVNSWFVHEQACRCWKPSAQSEMRSQIASNKSMSVSSCLQVTLFNKYDWRTTKVNIKRHL